jgi:hypothetical protein
MSGPTDSRRRSLIAAGVAVAIHLALFLVPRSLPAPKPATPVGAVDDVATDVEIDLVGPIASATPLPAIVGGPGEVPEHFAALVPATSASIAPSPPSVVEAAPSSSSAPPPLVLYGPAPAITFEIHPFLGNSGAPPSSPASTTSTTFHSARPDAPALADAKRNAEGAIKAGAREKDLGNGLGPDGPILTALRDATYGSTAPERGNATFLAVVDGNGLVVDLKLVASKGGEKGWEDARSRAEKALAGVKLSLRGARGAEVKVEVYSDIRLPSGRRPGDPPVKPTFSLEAPDQPGALDHGGGLPEVKRFTLGTFDLADIGAKPRRVVHARTLSLSTF